jgi:hypothetical protein
LNEFKSVTTALARYQNLSINQTKLSGQCGRLKCCLNYELDTYLDALQHFPEHVDVLQTAKGNAQLIKKDIFKNLMWYTLPDSNKQYPLSIETVKKIKAQNEKGIRPEELETAEVNSSAKAKEVEPQFVDVVGQISLKTLDRNAQKKKQRERQGNEGNRPIGRDANRPMSKDSGKQVNKEGNRQIKKEPVKQVTREVVKQVAKEPFKPNPDKKVINITNSTPKAPDEPRKIIRPIKENKPETPGE